MKRKLSVLAILLCGLWACTYDKEDELYGTNGVCNTDNVTYSVTVTGLLNSYGCLSCHTGPAPEGNINLQGYANVKTVAQNGRLYGAISHAPGFHPMPEGGTKMNQCDITRIKSWIDAGAPNN